MPKTQAEIDALKLSWREDPTWDIEETEGFEDHRAELADFRQDIEAARDAFLTVPDRCEWDPELAVAAGLDSGCQRPAAVIVGADGQWRLCSECAALPRFAKFKRRKTITRLDKPARRS